MSKAAQCCICLDEFNSPASLPCGHRFCLGCIGEYWRIHEVCQCPLCKAVFPNRPWLRSERTRRTQDEAVPLKAGEVLCDVCPSDCKRRAVRSCLTCLASYCSAHLEPHYQREELARHQLISVVKNLEDPVCRLHGKQLLMFCRSDQTCICTTCAQTEHRGHHLISVSREAAKKKSILRRRRSKLQQEIHSRQSKVDEMKLSEDVGGENAQAAPAQSKKLIEQLEEEITELQEKNTELERLSQTEDHLRFLQGFRHS